MRTLLVQGEKVFKIEIPDDAKVTFGPWSPPNKNGQYGDYKAVGTLRIYRGTKDNIIACFSGVGGFRDITMGYMEQVAKEEGATMWKSDQKGYVREEKVAVANEWVNPQLPAAPAPKPRKKTKKNGD